LKQPSKTGIIGLIFRILEQIANILYVCLVSVDKPKFILVQTPPAIPTLALFNFIAALIDVDLIVDWHNFGFSLLALGRFKSFVGLARIYEVFFARFSNFNLTVTDAMRSELYSWGIRYRNILRHQLKSSKHNF
jgi:beta-1,4-mannosyltransferase